MNFRILSQRFQNSRFNFYIFENFNFIRKNLHENSPFIISRKIVRKKSMIIRATKDITPSIKINEMILPRVFSRQISSKKPEDKHFIPFHITLIKLLKRKLLEI